MNNFYKSKSDKKLMGVVGGLSQNAGIDSNTARWGVVFLSTILLFTGIGLILPIAYILAGFFLPEK